MKLPDFTRWLDDTLQVAQWTSADGALNGLQVTRQNPEIRRVALAVDACEESFRRAADVGADILVVHHGLYWGKPWPLTGTAYQRVKTLMDLDLALYGAHLPLDAHPEVGNNIGLAQAIGLEYLEPFGEYHGKKIGWKGILPQAQTLENLCHTLFEGRENTLSILPFGPRSITKIGIVSGGATAETHQAIAEGLDLYITGDADHTIYHSAKEAGIHVISGGHYATETWGVRLLAKKIQRDLGLAADFLSLPTGL